MQFYDCPLFHNGRDVFNSISNNDLRMLQFDVAERKIPFKPATTDLQLPVGAAFLALNAYCGADYAQAFVQPNFIVWAQGHKTIRGQLFNLMGIYQKKVSELYSTAFYYTNFAKVVFPNPPFKASKEVASVLNESNTLRSLFQELLRMEVKGLVENGCRVFVCLGNDAQNYFKQTFYSELQENYVYSQGDISLCTLYTQPVFVLAERHFSRYRKENTKSLAQHLGEYIETTRGILSFGHVSSSADNA